MNRLSPGMFCTMNTDTVDQQLSSLFPLDDQQPANDINYLPNHDILNPIESQHYSPHLLLEQQFKLTQLQQLQQLQNQIFQQQVNPPINILPIVFIPSLPLDRTY